MKDFNIDFKVPQELQDNKFLQSTSKQYNLGKKLSEKQLQVINDILGTEETFDIDFETKYLYLEYFYRTDYHGDMLMDSNYIITPGKLLQERIQDLHALQYNSEMYSNKYKRIRTIEVPSNAIHFEYNFEVFEKHYTKLKRNRFRTTKSKNKCIRNLKNIIKNTYEG